MRRPCREKTPPPEEAWPSDNLDRAGTQCRRARIARPPDMARHLTLEERDRPPLSPAPLEGAMPSIFQFFSASEPTVWTTFGQPLLICRKAESLRGEQKPEWTRLTLVPPVLAGFCGSLRSCAGSLMSATCPYPAAMARYEKSDVASKASVLSAGVVGRATFASVRYCNLGHAPPLGCSAQQAILNLRTAQP